MRIVKKPTLLIAAILAVAMTLPASAQGLNDSSFTVSNPHLADLRKDLRSDDLNAAYKAAFRIGEIYFHGIYEPIDKKRAAEFFLKAAELYHEYRPGSRYTHAHTMYGIIWLSGDGVEKNEELATEHLKLGAYPPGNYVGLSNEETLIKEALSGNNYSQLAAGDIYRDRGETPAEIKQNKAIAAGFYHKSAQQGNPTAARKVAEMLLDGESMPVNAVKAKRYLDIAEKQPSLATVLLLADLHYNGAKDFKKDHWISLGYYRRAGFRDSIRARRTSGILYQEGGVNVHQDHKRALEWLVSAGEHGDYTGQLRASYMFRNGQGTRTRGPDWVNAWAWRKTASLQPEASSGLRNQLHRLEQQMTPKQIAQAKVRHLEHLQTIKTNLKKRHLSE